MKICRRLSSCLFAMGFLAVPLSPAQEAPLPAPAPAPIAAPAPAAAAADPTTALAHETGQGGNVSAQTSVQPPQQQLEQQQHADAERIALLESRVAMLERELQQLRATMKSVGAALSGAAAGGDVGNAPLTNRGAMTPRIPSAARSYQRPMEGSINAPAPTPATAGAAKDERTGFTSLPPAARARFVQELRERQNEFANASPEDRQAMVKETMERAQRAAADEARNSSGSSNNNTVVSPSLSPSASPTALAPVPVPMPPPIPAAVPAPALESAGRAPLPSLPTPAVPEASAPAPAPSSGTVTSTDASRQRFEALSEEQRHRFIEEMRKNREKLANATPAEREVIMHEALTKVEKEAAGAAPAAATGAAAAAATKTEPQPQPQQQQQPSLQQSKAKPSEGKKK